MNCRPLAIGPKVLWSLMSLTTALFHAMTGGLSTATIKKVRVAFGMYESTGYIQISPAYQTSDDCVTWSNLTDIGDSDTRDTDGITRLGYEDVGAAIEDKKFVRFGLKVINVTTDANREFANGWMEVDTKSC